MWRTKGTYYEYGDKASRLLTLHFLLLYFNLYQPEPSAMEDFLNSIDIPTIDPNIKN